MRPQAALRQRSWASTMRMDPWHFGGAEDKEQSSGAVIAALLPVCVSQSEADPNAIARTQHLGALSSVYDHRDFVMEIGWATMPGALSLTCGSSREGGAALAREHPRMLLDYGQP